MIPRAMSLSRFIDQAIHGRDRFVFGATGGATPDQGISTDPSNPNPVLAFCTDEDIARRAESDYQGLAGVSQVVAEGTDGLFGNPAGDPWTMASASTSFEAQGVMAGDVCQVTYPRVVAGVATYPTAARIFAIDQVASRLVTLRRLGLASGMGEPACPGVGLPAPVHFQIATLYPQILDASTVLRMNYGLDETIRGRRTQDLLNLAQFTEACAYLTLANRYMARARSAGSDGGDDYRAKADYYRDQYVATLDRLAIHFKPLGRIPQADMVRVGRLAR